MITSLLIFLGAGFGGVTRYWVANGIYSILGRDFPYGTLIVNISGSFLMGFIFIILMERFDGIGPPLRALLLIGFLGGYTTFSSFSMETINLIESGAWFAAGLNVFLSVLLCLSGTWLGVISARSIVY